ncbi:MAG: lytic transglycosylase domain-containing protein [Alphaproteobacteria bacterium]|nr:lytic transglycosylase domain-containing protein [Alphaproteobacteria bacterium]
MIASPAQSQMLRLRAAADTQSSKYIVAEAVKEASLRFHVPANWIRAVMRAESDGDDKAISEKGAIGLMQIMPKTYAELQTKLGLGSDPFDPHDNILAGAAYLAEMFERYGEIGVLAAYNAGPRRYEEFLHGRPLPDETTDYVARLAPELGFANVPAMRIPTPSDTLSAPLFVALTTAKLTQETTADGSINNASSKENAAPHPLFPARREDKIFARDPHSDGASNASLRAAPLQTAGLFVARHVSEISR